MVSSVSSHNPAGASVIRKEALINLGMNRRVPRTCANLCQEHPLSMPGAMSRGEGGNYPNPCLCNTLPAACRY
jgi:hypothetical protein